MSIYESTEYKYIKKALSLVSLGLPENYFLPAGFTQQLFELGFPPCLHLLDEDWLEAKSRRLSDMALIQFVIGKHDDAKINSIYEEWRSLLCEDPELLPILDEAINNYLSQRYYSCTALLVCQYGKAINENGSLLKSLMKDTGISKRDAQAKQKLLKKLAIHSPAGDGVNFETERNRVFRQMYIFENFETAYFLEYFDQYVYGNSYIGNHPNRPKICHGAKKDFGNQETALKSILCMDMILRTPQLFELTKNNP